MVSRRSRLPMLERAAASLLVMLLVGLAAAVSATSHEAGTLGAGPTIAPRDVTAPAESPPTATVAVSSPVDDATLPSAPSTDADQGGAGITAAHVFAFDLDTNATLYEADADTEAPIASTVKIATALVVVRTLDLADEVTIAPEDLVDPMVYSNMGLVAGDVLTVDQLLQGMLIPSGSDAANALARDAGTRLGGDPDPASAVAAFVNAMNGLAAELGLEHTHFTNPTGDDERGSYSSAHDIAVLGAVLMANDRLATIVGQRSYSFVSPGNGQTYEGSTTNQLLGVDGIAGIKTGSTERAGGCVVLYRVSPAGERTVIALLDAALTYQDNIIVQDSRWDDARRVIATIDAETE